MPSFAFKNDLKPIYFITFRNLLYFISNENDLKGNANGIFSLLYLLLFRSRVSGMSLLQCKLMYIIVFFEASAVIEQGNINFHCSKDYHTS